mmetsp:Transcript_92346/g.258074  ORF Transcript_92346/g.258074 Transcript_92346/m.258074 type:complete len:275 (+) Transcript_92346:67-891(+)
MGQNLAGIVFQPPPPTYDGEPWRMNRGEELIQHHWISKDNGNLIPAYYFTAEGAHFTMLFSHGNAEDLGGIRRYFHDFSTELRVNVFLYEYTGYGQYHSQCPGQPREQDVYSDIEAAFRYLRDDLLVPWTRIVPYGRSIGTAPSMSLATRTAVRGLVLQSPMTSIYRIPFQLRYTLPGDVFCNIDKVKDVCCPTFILYGTRDEIVPCWHGKALADRFAKEGTQVESFVVEGGDHNNLETQAGLTYLRHVHRFLRRLEEDPVPARLLQQAERSAI